MKKTILMTGGGTLGPVTPLIAIAKEWQSRDADLNIEWIGTPYGPERAVVESQGYHFQSLSVPKLSRHKWWTWPFILPLLVVSLVKSFRILKEMNPDIVFTVGGFTSVPLFWMSKILGIKTWVHQLDVQVGLANKLMAPIASRISVTWEESSEVFGSEKTLVVGGMVRPDILHGNGEVFLRKHKLDPGRKTVLVFGGGTGSESMNAAMEVIAEELSSKINVIHLTGNGKMLDSLQEIKGGYLALNFLNEDMKDAMDAADLVVARAGMGSMLELIALKKPAILIPIPNGQQEVNARLALGKEIFSVISHLTPQLLKQEIVHLLEDRLLVGEMKRNMTKAINMDAEKKIVSKAIELV